MHQSDCQCHMCKSMEEGLSIEEAIEKFKEEEEKKIKEFGWIIHFVQDVNYCNFHTHGLVENFNHPDLQIVVPLNPKLANHVFWEIFDLIKAGHKFEHNDIQPKIINFNIKFIDAKEGERSVLRIVLPDPSGELEENLISSEYRFQYD